MAADVGGTGFVLNWKGEEVRDAVRVAAIAGVNAAADEVVRIAKSLSPVLTGFNRSSIYREVAEVKEAGMVTAEIGTTSGYGGYLEEGTSRMMARPYIRPALYAARTERIIAQTVRERVGARGIAGTQFDVGTGEE